MIKKGDVVEGFGGSDVIVEGEMYVGGQEHFYLETHACIAVPSGEDNEMTLIASVQHLQAIQVQFIILHGYIHVHECVCVCVCVCCVRACGRACVCVCVHACDACMCLCVNYKIIFLVFLRKSLFSI